MIGNNMDDTERLDYLQFLLDQRRYTGKAILRWSENGRGIRLHETSRAGNCRSIRDAIDEFRAIQDALGATHDRQ